MRQVINSPTPVATPLLPDSQHLQRTPQTSGDLRTLSQLERPTEQHLFSVFPFLGKVNSPVNPFCSFIQNLSEDLGAIVGSMPATATPAKAEIQEFGRGDQPSKPGQIVWETGELARNLATDYWH